MHTPQAHAEGMAAFIAATLREIRAHVAQHQPVDLSGMPWDIGRLCAACLDLPPEQGRDMRPCLQEVSREIDALQSALLEAGP